MATYLGQLTIPSLGTSTLTGSKRKQISFIIRPWNVISNAISVGISHCPRFPYPCRSMCFISCYYEEIAWRYFILSSFCISKDNILISVNLYICQVYLHFTREIFLLHKYRVSQECKSCQRFTRSKTDIQCNKNKFYPFASLFCRLTMFLPFRLSSTCEWHVHRQWWRR